MNKNPNTPKRDPKTGRYLSKPSNRWDDPKSIRRKDFASGYVGLGMSPAESLDETFWCQSFTENYNFKNASSSSIKAVHHVRIDEKGLKIPDISFWLLDVQKIPISLAGVVVEVDKVKGLSGKKGAKAKAINAVEQHGIKEAFIYVIDQKRWLKYSQGTGWNKIALSKSKLLKIDLEDFNPYSNPSL